MEFVYTEEDILRGNVLDAGWYLLTITDSTEKPSKNKEKPSINWIVDFKVVAEKDSGDTRFAETPLRVYFNEGAPTSIGKFIAAMGTPLNPKGGKFVPNHAGYKGKQIYALCVPKPYEGKMVNNVEDYLPVNV